ncbi:uroporphyrinogen-III C-methyltransferase [Immundisolibacter sp.]
MALLTGAAVWLRGWQPLQAQLAGQAQTQADLARRLDALDAWQGTASDDLAALEGRSRALTARLEQLAPARLTAWSLAEADYLIRSAQRAAQLDYDPARAALALELASSSLAAVPGSSGLRAAIDSNRAALTKVRVPDLDTLSGQLAQAASALKTAPLREPGPVAVESTPPGWRGAAQQAWRQLSEVIVVQRVDAPVQPLLRPQEQQYLRQQLALKLAAADYALRRRDTSALHGELTDLRAWADAYLDGSTPATAQALVALDELGGLELSPALPDFSGLSEQLAALRRTASVDRMP